MDEEIRQYLFSEQTSLQKDEIITFKKMFEVKQIYSHWFRNHLRTVYVQRQHFHIG